MSVKTLPAQVFIKANRSTGTFSGKQNVPKKTCRGGVLFSDNRKTPNTTPVDEEIEDTITCVYPKRYEVADNGQLTMIKAKDDSMNTAKEESRKADLPFTFEFIPQANRRREYLDTDDSPYIPDHLYTIARPLQEVECKEIKVGVNLVAEKQILDLPRIKIESVQENPKKGKTILYIYIYIYIYIYMYIYIYIYIYIHILKSHSILSYIL